jgi:hypothetical protein
VRHIAVPHPGDWRQLCIQVARLHSRPLDRSKPLWEAYVIEGLHNVPGVPPGSFALYTKMHHSIVDGESGTEIMRALHSLTPEPPSLPRTGAASGIPPTMNRPWSSSTRGRWRTTHAEAPEPGEFSLGTARRPSLGAGAGKWSPPRTRCGHPRVLTGDLELLPPRMPPQTRFARRFGPSRVRGLGCRSRISVRSAAGR